MSFPLCVGSVGIVTATLGTVAQSAAEAAGDGDRLATMLRFFLIAGVAVSPFAVVTARRIRAARPGEVDPGDGAETSDSFDHNVEGRPSASGANEASEVSTVVAAIEAAAVALAGPGPDAPSQVSIALPAPLTLDGGAVDDAIAGALLADAGRQAGVIVSRDATSDPPCLVVRRAG